MCLCREWGHVSVLTLKLDRHSLCSSHHFFSLYGDTVAFAVYDIDGDGFITNGELFEVLKMMVGSNLTDHQLQNIVDKTILEADKDGDGKISFEEFVEVSAILLCLCVTALPFSFFRLCVGLPHFLLYFVCVWLHPFMFP